MVRTAHGLLAAGVAIALGCAGAAPVAQGPGAAGSAPPAEPATPAASAAPTATPTPGESLATAPAPSAGLVEMKPPIPTALASDLQALGLDAKSLPPIEKLEPKTLRGVMKLLARSLGVKCGDCHQAGDFAAPTRRKKIATLMWDEFAAKLAMTDGGALFCDSCHQGRIVQLDRHDKKALAAWMDDNFVTRLMRKDGQRHECETCHVNMDMTFLATWGR